MNDIKVVLDLWNWYIKGIVFGQEDDKTVVLAKEMVKTRGMRKWKILDLEDFALCINEILESFSRKLWGDFVEEVVVWISHPDCISMRVSEQKRVLSREIGHEDIAHLSDVVADASIKPNYEVLKIIPVLWIIDEEAKTKDPLWMEARKLELIADVFMVPKNYYSNLLDVFKKLDLHIVDIVPNILGLSEICLDFDLKDLGVLLVDIWANQTSFVVYEEGYPLFYWVLPVGGEEVTKDISIGLQVDIKEAEQIKREKGTIILDNRSVEDEAVDMRFLSDIIVARYEEIFELIQRELIKRQRDGRLPWGVFLTWGASKVEHVDLLAKDVFKLASFHAVDTSLRLWDLSENHQLLGVLWDYVWSNKYNHRRWRGFSLQFNFGFLSKMKEFFKQLF